MYTKRGRNDVPLAAHKLNSTSLLASIWHASIGHASILTRRALREQLLHLGENLQQTVAHWVRSTSDSIRVCQIGHAANKQQAGRRSSMH